MAPDLDIVIVTYNSAHVIGDLLDSIPSALDGLICDVVVVDNGSTDKTVDIVTARGGCRVIKSENLGYAAGINVGVRAADPARAILILNPDVRLASKSIPPLMAALRRPSVGIVAPQVRSAAGALELSLRREPSLLRTLGLARFGLSALSEYVTKPAAYSQANTADWAVGAALLMSRECYDAVGGWDESYFLYSEETDLCLRARDKGFLTRYEPRAVAVHLGGQSGRDSRTHAMQIVNRIRLYRRRHGSLASWGYYLITILSQAFWLVRGHHECKSAITAILRPSARPHEICCSDHLMPR